jgi:outer membrane protein OmpA-like peptidoglycan-associated protein
MYRSLAPTLTALALFCTGCKDDLKPATEAWTTVSTDWQSKVEALGLDSADQAKRLDALCKTEGLDPSNVAGKSCAELKVTQESDRSQLETLAAATTRHREIVAQAIKRGKLLEVQVAMDAAKAEVTMLLARATDNAQLRRDAGKALEAAVAQEIEAAKTAQLAAEAKAELWRQAALERRPLDLTDIHFTGRTRDLEPPEAGAQPQLQQLADWANSCAGLTFNITAHESKDLAPAEAKRLTDGRALAVKNYLIEHGVTVGKIVAATGAGSKQPVVEEPPPDSDAAKAMNPDDLEALRAKNRRITVQAVTVCPRAERAELNESVE